MIPVRDMAHCLGTTLNSLVDQEPAGGFEVIVADDGSTDGTGSVAVAFGESLDLRVVPVVEHRNAGHARNVGARAARGEFLVFIDGDDAARPGYLAAMEEALTSAVFVASAVVADREFGDGEPIGTPRDSILPSGFLPAAASPNLGVRASAFWEVGGFDAALPFGPEDTDLCWRLHLAGHELTPVPAAVLLYRLDGGRSRVRKGFRYGRAGCQLDLKFAAHGLRPEPPKVLARRAVTSAIRALFSFSSDDRMRWAFYSARYVGRLVGARDPASFTPLDDS